MADPVLYQNAYVAWTTATTTSAWTELPGVKTIAMPINMAELDDAAMGDTLEAKYPGLIGVPISVTCRQDFGATGLDSKVWARQSNRTAFRLSFRPVDTTVASTNPEYEVSKVRIFNSTPIDGSHGALLENKIEFRACSGAALARSTSS